MTATQTKVRRDTDSNLGTVIPADGEMAYDTTNDELRMGDGVTSGAIPHLNFKSDQNRKYTTATAAGSANALTASLVRSPGSLANGLTVSIVATANNTGSATLALNGLTATTIYKLLGGALVVLAAGDIVNGMVHDFLYYSGKWILKNPNPYAGITSVSQGNLNTSTGSVSYSGTTSTLLTLPGGQYGFYPLLSAGATNPTAGFAAFVGAGTGGISSTVLGTTALARITLNPGAAVTWTAFQRYVTASPPIDMGDGNAQGFMFALMNSAGVIESTYLADVPPWLYNGPTDARATMQDQFGKKYRNVQKRSIAELMDGAKPEYVPEEITMAVKNADMDLIPHPFTGNDLTGKKVILIDPMDERIGRMIAAQNAGGGAEISDAISRGLIYADNTKMKRKGPAGVTVYGLRFKYSGGNASA